MLKTIMNPSERIKADTLAFVLRMANGGLSDPLPPLGGIACGPANTPSGSRADALVRRVFEATVGSSRLSFFFEVSRLAFLPGTQTVASKTGKKSRVEYLHEATHEFPYLMNFSGLICQEGRH